MTNQSPLTAPSETGRHPIRKIEVFGVVDGDGKLFESHHVVGCDGRAEDEKDYGGVFLDRQAAHLLAGECGSDDNPLDVVPMTLTIGDDARSENPTVETECFVLIGLDGKPEIWPEAHDGGNFEGVISAFSVMPDMRNAAFMLTRRSEHEEFNIRKARLIVDSGSLISESDGSATPTQRLIDLLNSPPESGESFEQFKTEAYSLMEEAFGPQKPLPEVTPDTTPEPAREVSESNEAFMELLMNVKFAELLDKLPQAPEHVITAYAVTDASGQPYESSAYDEGPMLEVARKERTAWGVADEPQEVRKVILLVMHKAEGGES